MENKKNTLYPPDGYVVVDPTCYEKLFSVYPSEQNKLLKLGNWPILEPFETFRSGTGEKTKVKIASYTEINNCRKT